MTDSTAWVAPAGTPSQVLAQINNAGLVTAALYQTYQIFYRKEIRSNIVNGLQVGKPVTALVYLNAADAGTAATVTKLTSMLSEQISMEIDLEILGMLITGAAASNTQYWSAQVGNQINSNGTAFTSNTAGVYYNQMSWFQTALHPSSVYRSRLGLLGFDGD